ncbi:hypothetical protein FOMA001_g19462 [Fusarium oxysporum f. sp. matthiolae]|nr:hypothetical protein FOMA001_g19462 [Fusarium oxysporum f. sp. matthiolae]
MTKEGCAKKYRLSVAILYRPQEWEEWAKRVKECDNKVKAAKAKLIVAEEKLKYEKLRADTDKLQRDVAAIIDWIQNSPDLYVKKDGDDLVRFDASAQLLVTLYPHEYQEKVDEIKDANAEDEGQQGLEEGGDGDAVDEEEEGMSWLDEDLDDQRMED